MRKSFAGMVHLVDTPGRVRDQDVTPVDRDGIPEVLALSAERTLKGRESGFWWTVGEFRFEDEWAYDMAVARRVVRNGEVCFVFGVERGE